MSTCPPRINRRKCNRSHGTASNRSCLPRNQTSSFRVSSTDLPSQTSARPPECARIHRQTPENQVLSRELGKSPDGCANPQSDILEHLSRVKLVGGPPVGLRMQTFGVKTFQSTGDPLPVTRSLNSGRTRRRRQALRGNMP
jgi:hypothetical protein